MTTTAHHRTLAHEYAKGLHWRAAAYHMRQAIALYPGSPHKAGTLAAVDIAMMGVKADAWERMADEVGEPAYVLVEGVLRYPK